MAGYFVIDKITELVGRKYYWLSLRKDVKAYIKGCNICLGLKLVNYKFYRDLQLLPLLIFIEKPLNELCDQITDTNQLEERKFWLHFSHYRSTYKDDALWASQDYY